MSLDLTGYGPRSLRFDGRESSYEIWEEKFLTHLRLNKLHGVVDAADDTNENAETVAANAEKNADVYATMIPLLDDKSISLVMRDARNDGRKALKILRSHYRGNGTPRIISLYMSLCVLSMSSTESVTDYVLRAESASTSLKMAGKEVDDSLLIAMVMKGLPGEYRSFCTIVNQVESGKELSFEEFKKSLRSFEENQKSLQPNISETGIVS